MRGCEVEMKRGMELYLELERANLWRLNDVYIRRIRTVVALLGVRG
jgi:hypothetical protein